MRTFRKTAVAVISLTLAAAGLAGCGRSDTGGGAANTPGAAGSSIAEGKATGTLNVWAMGAEGEALPKLAAKFKADNPDVTVNVTAVPWADQEAARAGLGL